MKENTQKQVPAKQTDGPVAETNVMRLVRYKRANINTVMALLDSLEIHGISNMNKLMQVINVLNQPEKDAPVEQESPLKPEEKKG